MYHVWMVGEHMAVVCTHLALALWFLGLVGSYMNANRFGQEVGHFVLQGEPHY